MFPRWWQDPAFSPQVLFAYTHFKYREDPNLYGDIFKTLFALRGAPRTSNPCEPATAAVFKETLFFIYYIATM